MLKNVCRLLLRRYTWKELEFDSHTMLLVEPLDVFIALRRALLDSYAPRSIVLKVIKKYGTITIVNQVRIL